jgi:hypothetical protein
LPIDETLEVVSPAYFFGIPPELAPIWCDRFDTGYMDGPYPLCYYPVCLCEGWQSRFCCPGFLHASDVMLLERQVCVPPDAQPPLRLFVEPYEYVPDIYLRCQLRPEVFLVASHVRKQSRFFLCRIKL